MGFFCHSCHLACCTQFAVARPPHLFASSQFHSIASQLNTTPTPHFPFHFSFSFHSSTPFTSAGPPPTLLGSHSRSDSLDFSTRIPRSFLPACLYRQGEGMGMGVGVGNVSGGPAACMHHLYLREPRAASREPCWLRIACSSLSPRVPPEGEKQSYLVPHTRAIDAAAD